MGRNTEIEKILIGKKREHWKGRQPGRAHWKERWGISGVSARAVQAERAVSTKPWQRVGAQSTGGVSVPKGRLRFTSSEGLVYQQGLLEVCWQWTGHIAEGKRLAAPQCRLTARSSSPVVMCSHVQGVPPSRDVCLSLVPRFYYFRFNQGSMLMKTKGPMRMLMLLIRDII